MFRVDIMTLFDLTVGDVLSESILGRAQERDILRIEAHQIRDYTLNRQKQVDDYPYGGGHGAVMQADPLYQCWKHITDAYGGGRTIYLSPAGKTFCQARARELARECDHLILVCGHYEGIDERFIEECVDEEISLGDFVLTGGEIAAMAAHRVGVPPGARRPVRPGVLRGGEPLERPAGVSAVLPARGVARPKGPRHPPLRRPQKHCQVAAQAGHCPHPGPPPGYVRPAGPLLQGRPEAPEGDRRGGGRRCASVTERHAMTQTGRPEKSCFPITSQRAWFSRLSFPFFPLQSGRVMLQ